MPQPSALPWVSEVWNYVFAVLVCFSAPFFGFWLAKIAKEEIKHRNYFEWTSDAILALIAFAAIPNKIIGIVAAVIIFLLLLKFKIRYTIAVYAIFAVLLFLARKNLDHFILMASLIFIYGFPEAALLTENMFKEKKSNVLMRMLKEHIIFLVIALPLLISYP
jgi:hypothetical protein